MTTRMMKSNKAPHMNAAMTIPARAPATTRIQLMYGTTAASWAIKVGSRKLHYFPTVNRKFPSEKLVLKSISWLTCERDVIVICNNEDYPLLYGKTEDALQAQICNACTCTLNFTSQNRNNFAQFSKQDGNCQKEIIPPAIILEGANYRVTFL